MTLQEKVEKIIAAKDTDGMYDAVQKLTDNQKDIAIVSLIKMIRGETPMGWDIQMFQRGGFF